jgi:hypothetical protein
LHIKRKEIITLHLLHDDEEYPFEEWFVTWVRAALKPRECCSNTRFNFGVKNSA